MGKLLFLALSLVLLPLKLHAAWSNLAPGLDLGKFITKKTSQLGNSQVVILRIDPKQWTLKLVGKFGNSGLESKSAKDWSRDAGLVAAINAGMYKSDNATHVGYVSYKGRVHNSQLNHYQSIAAFDPKQSENIVGFRIFDLDQAGTTLQTITQKYSSVVQNLRLIKRPGENRWPQQVKLWSEAALGEDKTGNVLFIFSRSPYTMHDFNSELLALDIDLIAAQHLEGGPEAQLYLNVGTVKEEMFGSFETNFRENDSNSAPWPIPNVLGIVPRDKN